MVLCKKNKNKRFCTKPYCLIFKISLGNFICCLCILYMFACTRENNPHVLPQNLPICPPFSLFVCFLFFFCLLSFFLCCSVGSYPSDIWALGCVLYEMCTLKHAVSTSCSQQQLLCVREILCLFFDVNDKTEPVLSYLYNLSQNVGLVFLSLFLSHLPSFIIYTMNILRRLIFYSGECRVTLSS